MFGVSQSHLLKYAMLEALYCAPGHIVGWLDVFLKFQLVNVISEILCDLSHSQEQWCC